MPFRPELWAFWAYLFGMPHVFASLHTLADREYLDFYGSKLLVICVVFLALPFVTTHFLGASTLFLIFMGFAVYHTVVQQFGIALAALKQKPDVYYKLWKWSAIGVGLVLYTMIYSSPIPMALDIFNPARIWMVIGGGLLLATCLFTACVLMWKSNNRVGAAHVFVNTALVALDFALFQQGYFVFIVIVGRVIHEFTAWHIYATHDKNRAAKNKPNLVIKALSFSRIPAYPLSILAAFIIGIAVTYGLNLSLATNLILSLSLIHYYSESFIWKNGTIHRESLRFSQ